MINSVLTWSTNSPIEIADSVADNDKYQMTSNRLSILGGNVYVKNRALLPN
jgi:hypothetical protein